MAEGTTTGGIINKVLTGRTARSLQSYRDSKDEGTERYLFSATRHCSHDVETQIAEWKRVRQVHETDNATRRQKAKYEKVDVETGLHDNGQMGTHVREFHAGRWRKRPVKAGEIPTHLRFEPEDLVVKESEAVHSIYAAGHDLVNPENPEDCKRFFDAVVAERAANYPGVQESIWAERNGTSGLLHVHVASNSTVYEDFTANGVQYRAGDKMFGDLTRVHAVRRNFNRFLREHPEHGFEQSLAEVGSKKYIDAQVKSNQKDYWERTRSSESAHDLLRRETLLSLDEVHGDPADFTAELKARGVKIKEVGLRRGKPTKDHDYSYQLEGSKAWVRGKTLGEHYSYAGIQDQLALRKAGQEIVTPDVHQRAGEPVPLPMEDAAVSGVESTELTQLRADVHELATAERDAQAREVEQAAVAVVEQPAVEPVTKTPDEKPIVEPKLEVTEEPRSVTEEPTGKSFAEMFAELKAAPITVDMSYLDKYAAEQGYRSAGKTAEPKTKTETEQVEKAETVTEVPVAAPVEQEVETPERETEAEVDEHERKNQEDRYRDVETETDDVEQVDEADDVEQEPEALPFRSRLRDRRVKPGAEEKRDAIAQIEEDYHERETDAEFEDRIKAIGVGPRFIKAFGRDLDDPMRQTLEARAQQAAERAGVFQLHKDALAERARAKETSRTSAGFGTDREADAMITEGVYGKHLSSIDTARAQGDYRPHRPVSEVLTERRREVAKSRREQRLAELGVDTGESRDSSTTPTTPAAREALKRQQERRAQNAKLRERAQQQNDQSYGLG